MNSELSIINEFSKLYTSLYRWKYISYFDLYSLSQIYISFASHFLHPNMNPLKLCRFQFLIKFVIIE